jgi:hypothetical protein
VLRFVESGLLSVPDEFDKCYHRVARCWTGRGAAIALAGRAPVGASLRAKPAAWPLKRAAIPDSRARCPAAIPKNASTAHLSRSEEAGATMRFIVYTKRLARHNSRIYHNCMQITFDHAKDEINVEKHGVSLSAATDFEWSHPRLLGSRGKARRVDGHSGIHVSAADGIGL